jgi:hypothetical protein
LKETFQVTGGQLLALRATSSGKALDHFLLLGFTIPEFLLGIFHDGTL